MGQPGFPRSQLGRPGSSGPAAPARPARGSSRRVRAPRGASGSRGAVGSPLLGSPRFVSGSHRLGKAGGAGAGAPFREARSWQAGTAGALPELALFRALRRRSSLPGPRCEGWGWGWGRAGTRAGAAAALGGSGGSGMRPQPGRDPRCRLRAQPARRSVCQPGVLAGKPAHGLQLLTGGISPSWELKGWPGCRARRFGHAEPLAAPGCAVSSSLPVPVSDTNTILFSFLIRSALRLIYL